MKILFLSFTSEDIGVTMVTNINFEWRDTENHQLEHVAHLLLHRKEPGVASPLLRLLVSGNWALTKVSLKLLGWW